MTENVQRWAHIKDGVVTNVSFWDGDLQRWQPPEDETMMVAPDHVGRDWRYVDGEWLAPLPPPEPEPQPQEETPAP